MAAAVGPHATVSGNRSRGIFSMGDGGEENQSGTGSVPRALERRVGARGRMSRPLLVFAPGAGAPSTHPWMQNWKERLQTIGEVELFEYDYMREGGRRPDPLPMLIAAHRSALRNAQKEESQPVFLAGKSMGGRIGCHLSLEEPVTGLICFGYPLCGGGDPKKLRDKVLRDLRTPILFVQGTRDSLCPLDLLEEVRKDMNVENYLHVVQGGDHSLLVGKKQLRDFGQDQEQVDAAVLAAINEFVGQLCQRPR